MKKLILGVLLGAAAVFAALGVHIVRDSGGIFLVPKASWTLEHSYVDTSSYGVAEFLELPKPVQQKLAARKAAAVKGEVDKALDGLR